MSSLRVAMVQMSSRDDMRVNLEVVRRQMQSAHSAGAKMVLFPENVARMAARTPQVDEGAIVHFFEELCRYCQELGLWAVAGTLPWPWRTDGEPVPGNRGRAACMVINDQGELSARYDKIHLFDADVADTHARYRESEHIEPGNEPVTVSTPWGTMGIAVCYDLRFAEQFRYLSEAGAEWIVVPAAFTETTGEAHWEVLLRARAIENQLYILGVGQCGEHAGGRRTWGHSMAVDPWGTVLAEAEAIEQLLVVDLDLTQVSKRRQAMPVTQHRRRDLW